MQWLMCGKKARIAQCLLASAWWDMAVTSTSSYEYGSVLRAPKQEKESVGEITCLSPLQMPLHQSCETSYARAFWKCFWRNTVWDGQVHQAIAFTSCCCCSYWIALLDALFDLWVIPSVPKKCQLLVSHRWEYLIFIWLGKSLRWQGVMGAEQSWEISIRRAESDLLLSSKAIGSCWWMKHEVKRIRRWVQVKGAEQLGPGKKARMCFLAGGEWSNVILSTVNKEMFCLPCVGTKLLQTAPPTEVLILEEVVPVGEWTLQPFPLLLLGLQDGAHVRESQSASALSTIWGPCSAAASCQGAGKHPERGVERVWSICRAEAFQSFVCWRAAGQQAQGGGNTGTGETREELEEWGQGLVLCIGIMGMLQVTDAQKHFGIQNEIYRNYQESNCFAKGCCFLLLEQGLRQCFCFFPIFLPSAILRPFIVPVYFQDESVGSHCFDRGSKPRPPAVSTLLL